MSPQRGLGSQSKRSAGIASGSKTYVRHTGTVYGRSTGHNPGRKHFYRHTYTIPAWDAFIKLFTIGTLVQVCCGASKLGLVRVDLDPSAPGVNVIGDALHLPLADHVFDTVACDPIYEMKFPERVRLQRELARVARRRILFKGPWIPRAKGWRLNNALLLASHTCQNTAVLSVLDHTGDQLRWRVS